MLRSFRWAMSLLTIIPVAPAGPPRDRELARASVFFPAVGALVGLLGWAANSACVARTPDLVRGLFVIGVWAVATRGLHLDGLADTADGLAALGGREKALSAMRDPRIGALGAAALVLVLMTQAACIAGLSDGRVLVVAATSSRLSMTVSARLFPYARESGLGSGLIGNVSTLGALSACAIASGIVFATGREPALATLGVGCGAGLAVSGLAALKLGGATGDTLGASGELAQTAALAWAVSS